MLPGMRMGFVGCMKLSSLGIIFSGRLIGDRWKGTGMGGKQTGSTGVPSSGGSVRVIRKESGDFSFKINRLNKQLDEGMYLRLT